MALKSVVNRFVYHPLMSRGEAYLVGAIDGLVLGAFIFEGDTNMKLSAVGAGILAHYVGCLSGRERQAREETRNLEILTGE